MAAIAYVFTISRAAQILGRDEDLLSDLLDNLEPEDGLIRVHDIGGETPAFTEVGIETRTVGCRRLSPLSSISWRNWAAPVRHCSGSTSMGLICPRGGITADNREPDLRRRNILRYSCSCGWLDNGEPRLTLPRFFYPA
jgi:hypothetical protein